MTHTNKTTNPDGSPRPHKITLELDAKDALVAHIQGLQDTLTRRNEKIADLEVQLTSSKEYHRGYDAGYRDGRKAAAGELMDTTKDAARALGKVRKDAFAVYLRAEQEEG